MVKRERERRLDLSFRVKISLNADAPIRTAGGLTRTQHLARVQKKSERSADEFHPQCGSTSSALST